MTERRNTDDDRENENTGEASINLACDEDS